MGTRTQLETLIADSFSRTDLSTQITAAVDTAIYVYEKERFHFNEAYKVTATLSTSAATIPLSSISPPMLTIDNVRVVDSAGNVFPLYKRDRDWIMACQDGATGTTSIPLEFCVYNNQLMFDSYSDANYTILVDGIKSLGSSATNSHSMSSSTTWFSEAKQLIFHRARREVLANKVKDWEAATVAKAQEDDAYNELKARVNALQTTGFIAPTQY